MLRSLSIQNYKSLHDVRLELPQFFALVGANAAGKTNFADAIEFLAIVAKSGLASAVSEKGGYENICFRRERRSKGAIKFGAVIDIDIPILVRSSHETTARVEWSWSFRASREAIRSPYEVETESIALFEERDENKSQSKPAFSLNRTGDKVNVRTKDAKARPWSYFEKLLVSQKSLIRPEELVLWNHLRGYPLFELFLDHISRFRIFQIAPLAARKAGAASGNQELGKAGDNLPGTLEWLSREAPAGRKELLEYLRLAVPTIENVITDYVETRELGLFVKEAGMRRRMFASELSDGTLRTLAMFLPLVDPRYPLVVIEEPENSIHPWVVRSFVDACRARSAEKQIILTTHSPVLVSRLDPSELYVAERKDAETTIRSVRDVSPEVDQIIRKGIQDLGSYWDSGAMRAVPSEPQFEFMEDGKNDKA